MIAHFIGNGASQSLFGNFHYGTIVVGNITKSTTRWDACSIIDTKVILYMKANNIHLKNKTIWCTKDIAKQAQHHKIQGIWQVHYEPKHRYNSGHHAVEKLSKTHKIINLYGMDSMFTDDLTSQMDDRVPRPKRPPLNNEWRPHWSKMFAKHPDVLYRIHVPQGTKEIEYGKNCRFVHHQT
tara:strand:- start:1657 stop:2199 length:543 start_codon:yes stop_codon:yes gene_type:complete